MDPILSLTIILGIAFIISEIFYRFGFPRIIGQLITGILIATTPLINIITPSIKNIIETMSNIGIILLLLIAGMELNLKMFKKEIDKTFILSIFTTVIPFLLGVGVGRILGYDWTISLVIGGALSVTAEGTITTVLVSQDLINTRIGTYILGAGIIDDIVEVLLISFVSFLALKGSNHSELVILPDPLMNFSVLLILFAVTSFLIVKIVPFFIRKIYRERSRIADFSAVILVTFAIAALTNILSFGYAIGAFFAGIIIQKTIISHPKIEKELEDELKTFALGFIVPFFFVNIGLHFDISVLTKSPLMVLLLLGAGIIGKFLGSLASYKLLNISFLQSTLIGWAMNARGAIELVVIEIARQNGLITGSLYSAIVVMTVISSFFFPTLIKFYKRINPRIME